LTLQIKNSDLKFLLFKSVDFLNPKKPVFLNGSGHGWNYLNSSIA